MANYVVLSEQQLNQLIANAYELDGADRDAVEAARANRNNRRTLYRRVTSRFFENNEVVTLSDKGVSVGVFTDSLLNKSAE